MRFLANFYHFTSDHVWALAMLFAVLFLYGLPPHFGIVIYYLVILGGSFMYAWIKTHSFNPFRNLSISVQGEWKEDRYPNRDQQACSLCRISWHTLNTHYDGTDNGAHIRHVYVFAVLAPMCALSVVFSLVRIYSEQTLESKFSIIANSNGTTHCMLCTFFLSQFQSLSCSPSVSHIFQ